MPGQERDRGRPASLTGQGSPGGSSARPPSRDRPRPAVEPEPDPATSCASRRACSGSPPSAGSLQRAAVAQRLARPTCAPPLPARRLHRAMKRSKCGAVRRARSRPARAARPGRATPRARGTAPRRPRRARRAAARPSGRRPRPPACPTAGRRVRSARDVEGGRERAAGAQRVLVEPVDEVELDAVSGLHGACGDRQIARLRPSAGSGRARPRPRPARAAGTPHSAADTCSDERRLDRRVGDRRRAVRASSADASGSTSASASSGHGSGAMPRGRPSSRAPARATRPLQARPQIARAGSLSHARRTRSSRPSAAYRGLGRERIVRRAACGARRPPAPRVRRATSALTSPAVAPTPSPGIVPIAAHVRPCP